VAPHRRLLAWIYTGPFGHLYGTSADIATAWASWGASVARERAAATRERVRGR
jgi:hypothetical protein